jgi:hypothetical protein
MLKGGITSAWLPRARGLVEEVQRLELDAPETFRYSLERTGSLPHQLPSARNSRFSCTAGVDNFINFKGQSISVNSMAP